MKNKSFTLIELLVVIVIIGILAGVITMTTNTYIEQANLAKAQAFSSNASNRLWKNLISEWTFDLPAVEGVTEDTGGSNDGTVVGATHIPRSSDQCVYGGCYSFDGENDYIIANQLKNQNSNECSVSVWINTSKDESFPGENILIGFNNVFPGVASSGFSIRLRDDKPSIAFRYADNSNYLDLYSGSKIIDGNWHLITGTYKNGDYLKKYVDGVLTQSVAATQGYLISTDELIIGGIPGNTKYLEGILDDVRIYNTALSLSEIKQEYVAGLDSLYSKGLISKEEYNKKIESLAFEGS